jgi:integrase
LTVLFGLRRSEVLGLKWDSVNFELGLITIKHTVVRYEEVYEKDTTKTTSSYRSYPLSEDVKQILISIKDKENEKRKLFGKEYIENDYIFKWDNGKPYAPDYITSKFAKLLKSNNLPHIRFHDLRHSCATLMRHEGVKLEDIQKWLGHSQISTTEKIYAHFSEDQHKNSAMLISNCLG